MTDQSQLNDSNIEAGKPTEALADVLRGTLSANFEEVLGFDAWAASLTAEQERTLDQVLRAATTHPSYLELAKLDVLETSDDADAVNDVAYEIVESTLTQLGFKATS